MVQQERMLEAAQAAVRVVCRKAAARQRQPNPAVDVAPPKAAYVLMLWAIQDAGLPGSYRAHGSLFVPQPGKPKLYMSAAGVLERVVDLALEPKGRVIWTVANCRVQGTDRTMLLGVVRLPDGKWSLFRQIATQHGNAVVFELDRAWYNNRVKRSEKHSS